MQRHAEAELVRERGAAGIVRRAGAEGEEAGPDDFRGIEGPVDRNRLMVRTNPVEVPMPAITLRRPPPR